MRHHQVLNQNFLDPEIQTMFKVLGECGAFLVVLEDASQVKELESNHKAYEASFFHPGVTILNKPIWSHARDEYRSIME